MERIGGYRDLFPAEDTDLFLRLAEEGKLANVPEILLDYRVHPGNVSQKNLRQGVLKSCARRRRGAFQAWPTDSQGLRRRLCQGGNCAGRRSNRAAASLASICPSDLFLLSLGDS